MPEIDMEIIRRIEDKMLPSPAGRDRDASVKTVLTREECQLYADYCESIGRKLSAEYFANPKKK